MDHMREMPELEWVHTDYLQPYPMMNVTLDPVTSSQLGVTRSTASITINSATGDLRVGQIWAGDYEMPIVVKDTANLNFSDVENLGIATPLTMAASQLSTLNSQLSTNTTVPLRQIAKVQPQWTESRIMHRGGERCITVTAQFAQGVYAAPVESRVAEIMENEIDLPQGVRAEVGGEIEYNSESIPQIFGGVAISMIIVFFFLLFNF